MTEKNHHRLILVGVTFRAPDSKVVQTVEVRHTNQS